MTRMRLPMRGVVTVLSAVAVGFAAWGCSSSGGGDGSKTPAEPDSLGADVTLSDAGPSDDSGPPPGDDGPPPSTDPVIDLRVDNNRNGALELDEPSEDEAEDTWDATHGAIFLANIDDDLEVCDPNADDVDLPKCHDAADEELNGEADLPDLAPLAVKAWATAPEGTTARLTVTPPAGAERVRLFKKVIPTNPIALVVFDPATDSLSAADLQAGVELALEGKDIVRDAEVWDGFITITLTVQNAAGEDIGTDAVRMRVSPVMTYHHALEATQVHAAFFSFGSSASFRAELKVAMEGAGIEEPLVEMPVGDQWTQDYFETGYMSMPGPGGEQHVIKVAYRSANVSAPNNLKNPLRQAGKVAFTYFRGPDSAGVQHYQLEHSGYMDSLNSFGNTETIPPYSKDGVDYPLGRLYRGSTDTFFPDPLFSTMVESQGMQPPVYVDTSWLLVGHVDETISFVRADNERGWTIAVNDPTLAIEMLNEQVAKGNGNVEMFVGKNWDTDDPAAITIKDVLDDNDVMEESEKGIALVDEQLQILLDETGLPEDEVLHLPFLHHSVFGLSVAYQPGTVNGISLSQTVFASPRPYGPKIDGVDIFEAQMIEEYAKVGVTVYWVEDWDLYHVLLGEVHCGSNAFRETPSVKWWETGR